MGNPGFRMHNAVGDVAQIDIYADIDPFWGVSGESFRDELKQVTASKLEVHINSGGGDVHEGLAIMNSLKDHPAEITVIVDGIAASAASFIAVGSGGRLIMHEASTLMIHDAWTFAGGDAAELEKTAGLLDKMSDLIAGIYAAKAGTPVEEWREAMREESWFTAEEAVAVGLADEMRSSAATEPVSAGMRSRILNSGTFKYGSREEAPTPSIFARRGKSVSAEPPTGEKGETMSFLKNLATRLGMADTDDITEEKVLAAVEEVLEEQANEPAEPQQTPPAEEPAEDDGLTVTVDKAKYEELEADAELGRVLREEKQAEEAAEAVEAAVKDGRLGAVARAAWTEKFLADPAGTARLLDSLPKGRINRSETGHAHDVPGESAADGIPENLKSLSVTLGSGN